MASLRIGIIGVGNIGTVHAQQIFQGHIPGMTLAALCDIRNQLEESCRSRFPGIPFCTDPAQLLARADVDAVIISVPHPSHSSLAIQAFSAGKHVLMEKPLDIRLSQALNVCQAAEKSGKKFGIMLNQRTGNLFQKARQIVQSGKLGQLKRSVWIVTNWYRTQHYYESGHWRATWLGEGGGVLVNQAPHQLDLWQWICGMPTQITAFCDTGKYHNVEVEDDATIFARFPGGATGTFITSTGEAPGTNRLEISGSRGKLVLENGVLKWWKLEQDERVVCCESKESSAKIPFVYEEFNQDTVRGHEEILKNFAAAILRGEPLLAPGQDGLAELTIQNAAYLSAWTGQSVDLPFDTREFDRLLTQKQQSSSLQCSQTADPRRLDYDPRWQINW